MMPDSFLWDIFCQVVDNHGDLGVCWRLSQHMVSLGQRVRLYVDEPSALSWMAPKHSKNPSLQILPWPKGSAGFQRDGSSWESPDAVVEAFGCEIPALYLETLCAMSKAEVRPWTWINLEYLSAEDYPERMHQLVSPVMSGPAKGMNKWFFYPGFTAQTGGLLEKHPPGELKRETPKCAADKSSSLMWHCNASLKVFLFSYEPKALKDVLIALSNAQTLTHLKVSQGRASSHTHEVLQTPPLLALSTPISPNTYQLKNLRIEFIDHVDQEAFDTLLESSDLNFVRGEDSWVRAIWAQKAFVWQIYPQDDGIHFQKMNAFLNRFEAPDTLKQAFWAWNGFNDLPMPDLTPERIRQWSEWTQGVAEKLRVRPDLASQLLAFLGLKQQEIPPLGPQNES